MEGIYDVQGSRMYVDDKDTLNLTQDGICDPKQTQIVKDLSKGNVIDIGANIGYYTLIMAKTSDKVYAFEPDPSNFNILKANISLNKLSNVVLFNSAVTDYNGVVNLHLCEFNRGMHRIYPSKWCEGDIIRVNTVKIDDIINERINFIKLDTEGAELGVLKGMKKLLGNYHPVIMIEFHPPSILECGDNPKDVFDIIVTSGYNNFKLLGTPDINNISYKELEEITFNSAARNVICT